MPLSALTSAEISLPAKPDGLRVRERIAALADTVDLVGLTDNHAGQARMSPLAAVALAREQRATNGPRGTLNQFTWIASLPCVCRAEALPALARSCRCAGSGRARSRPRAAHRA